jgi:hypothetical protein
MTTIKLTATAGPDGVLRLAVPVGAAGGEYDVVLTPKPPAARKPTPEELGWPPGYIENTFGSIDDETFVAPPRSRLTRPVPPLDVEE